MKIKGFEKPRSFWCGYKRSWYSENSRLTYDKITTNKIHGDQWGLDKITGNSMLALCCQIFWFIFVQVSSQFPRQGIGE